MSLCGETTKDHYREEQRDGMDQSALLEVLEALRNADAADRIKQAAETIYPGCDRCGVDPGDRRRPARADGDMNQPAQRVTAADDQYHGRRFGVEDSQAAQWLVLRGIVGAAPRLDQCFFAMVMEAYLHGTSTRKVDDLVDALGAEAGISKSEVSRIRADLDTEVAAFRDRPLADQWFPSVFLDATCCHARVNHRVVSQALVIATGVVADGRHEVLGFDVGGSEDGAFWTAFLLSLESAACAGCSRSSPMPTPGSAVRSRRS